MVKKDATSLRHHREIKDKTCLYCDNKPKNVLEMTDGKTLFKVELCWEHSEMVAKLLNAK